VDGDGADGVGKVNGAEAGWGGGKSSGVGAGEESIACTGVFEAEKDADGARGKGIDVNGIVGVEELDPVWTLDLGGGGVVKVDFGEGSCSDTTEGPFSSMMSRRARGTEGLKTNRSRP
jgi:hypothetical protein